MAFLYIHPISFFWAFLIVDDPGRILKVGKFTAVHWVTGGVNGEQYFTCQLSEYDSTQVLNKNALVRLKFNGINISASPTWIAYDGGEGVKAYQGQCLRWHY